MPIIGSPVTATDLEGLTLDSLVLNDGTFGLTSLDLTPPKQRADWVGSADSEYSALFRDPLYENRTITAKLSIAPQADMDAALAHIADVRDKLAEASKLQDGLEFEWVPANGTTSVTFDVLAGEITELPIDWENGWLAQAPTITIVMTAKPYWRRTVETTLTAVSSGTSPVTTVEIPDVGGDAPALGRLIISNTGTGAIRWLEWGLEQRGYNASSPDSLVLDSDGLVTSGFAGTGATRSGAYDPGAAGNSVIRVTVPTSATAVCGTGTQSHVGRFRISADVYCDSATTYLRFVWRAGDGGYTSESWVKPPVTGALAHVDLAVIDIPVASVGTQAWDGRIEAYDTTITTGTLDVDLLQAMPSSDGYGRSKTDRSTAAGVLVASDSFTGTTTGNALNARTPPLGSGAWATSGAATDFVFDDFGVFQPGEGLRRTSTLTTFRFGVLHSSMAGTQVQVDCKRLSTGDDLSPHGVVARWVDASNYIRLTAEFAFDGVLHPHNVMKLVKVVAGVETVLGTYADTSASWLTGRHRTTLGVTAGGAVTATVDRIEHSGPFGKTLTAQDNDLATGGVLASGKPGIIDSGSATAANARIYDDVIVYQSPPESIIVNAGRDYEVRYYDTLRESASGGTWGREQSYRGRRFLIPPSGTENRTSRVAVRANTVNLDSAALGTAAAYTVAIAYTERGLVVPR